MRSRFWFLMSGCLIVIAFGSIAILGLDSQTDHGKGEPKGAAIHWAKGQAPGQSGRGGKSPNLTYHGGPIMETTATTAIFWGDSWAYESDANVKIKVDGIDSFYGGLGDSAYAGTSSEYTDVDGKVTNTITYNGHLIDKSKATGGNQTAPILAEVCKVISNPVSNGYYPVYVNVKRGNAGFCAWHSYGTCGGTMVQFAFFFDLDGDVGCDPKDSSHPQGLAALVNVSGHEISEARTDPRLNAWYDSSGDENSDKCAWTFGPALLTLTNGTKWKIQGNWSNSAYNLGKSYSDSSGPRGCIDGPQ